MLYYGYFAHDVYLMCVNFILTHIQDAFGFPYKTGCDRRLALQLPWRTCDCSLVLVNSWVIVYFCKMRKNKLKILPHG
jgi:hypothetical protein